MSFEKSRTLEDNIDNTSIRDLLKITIDELRVMNFHLSLITDNDIKTKDIENAD